LRKKSLLHEALHDWLVAERSAGRKVLGYGAASKAVALLCQARVDRRLLPTVIDASPGKQGLQMAGTDIQGAAPARVAADKSDAVLLFVPDLLAEVRDDYPEVEAAGGR
jgi:C-methyltransferase C-terminal domain